MSTCARPHPLRRLVQPAWLLILWVAVLAGCGGDGTTRICFGSDEFCDRVFGGNRPPQADAGADQEVASGSRVLLDGSASRDPDGHITAYAWTQEAGPPVALEQAASAVARFDAPVVQVSTVLIFRLLVTDNRGASDIDRAQVTVLPSRVGALDRGLLLLKDSLRPPPLPAAGLTGTTADPGFLGLWLGARVTAVSAARDDEVDRLLDELRVIMLAGAAAPPGSGENATPDAEAAAQRRLLALGAQTAAWFTLARDPGTAALAMPDPAAAEPVDAQVWAAAIAAALPELAGPEASLDTLQGAAERLLLADPAGVPPAWLAAATLILALPAEGTIAEARSD